MEKKEGEKILFFFFWHIPENHISWGVNWTSLCFLEKILWEILIMRWSLDKYLTSPKFADFTRNWREIREEAILRNQFAKLDDNRHAHAKILPVIFFTYQKLMEVFFCSFWYCAVQHFLSSREVWQKKIDRDKCWIFIWKFCFD